jgi:hypothetical protein
MTQAQGKTVKVPHNFETLNARLGFPASDGEEVNVTVTKY